MERYRIATNVLRCKLEQYVNDLTTKGWQPLGGITSEPDIGNDGRTIYMQAMVRQLDTTGRETDRRC